jgi:N-acetyl-anhydromuramyl-L-alanine amidase AmpD
MKLRITRWLLIFLVFIGFVVALLLGKTYFQRDNSVTSNPDIVKWSQYPKFHSNFAENQQNEPQDSPRSKSNSAITPPMDSPTNSNSDTATPPIDTPTDVNNDTTISSAIDTPTNYNSDTITSSSIETITAFANYKPRYEVAWANPTNFGERYSTDINGEPVNNQPIIVLHETSFSASSAINFFQNPHEDDSKQASYHTMIKLDGTVVYIVPPEKRAFGAGNSVFEGSKGVETVKTNAELPPSVNNFAYHAALETPPSAYGNEQETHSGYTEAQYHSLAWLIAQSDVPDERITTHRAVDRSGQRIDPRSFDFDKFLNLLHSYRQANLMQQHRG